MVKDSSPDQKPHKNDHLSWRSKSTLIIYSMISPHLGPVRGPRSHRALPHLMRQLSLHAWYRWEYPSSPSVGDPGKINWLSWWVCLDRIRKKSWSQKVSCGALARPSNDPHFQPQSRNKSGLFMESDIDEWECLFWRGVYCKQSLGRQGIKDYAEPKHYCSAVYLQRKMKRAELQLDKQGCTCPHSSFLPLKTVQCIIHLCFSDDISLYIRIHWKVVNYIYRLDNEKWQILH